MSLLFSILVPTRNRPELLAGCLAAIRAQRAPPGFEVVVLDQSDGPPAAEADARIRHIGLPPVGKSAALNHGIPIARGAWIVLIDDDCEPEPDWLAALAREVESAPARSIVVGRVLPGPIAPGMAPPPATLTGSEPRDQIGPIDADLLYPNAAIPRDTFAEVGGFDPRLGPGTPLHGAEDNDYAYRLLRAGYRILYRPAPTVVHRAWRTPAERLALKRDYGVGQGAFYAKHVCRGDGFVARRFARDVARSLWSALRAALGGRGDDRRGAIAYLRGLFAGAWRMGRLPRDAADRP